MNISRQIKHYRNYHQYSQEDLAEKIYVSRQTISNWENGHSYPDLETILRLSVLFDVSLDQLVKGDLDTMKQEIKKSAKVMNRWSWVMMVSYLLSAVLFGPMLSNTNGILDKSNVFVLLIIPFLPFFSAFYAAYQIEKIKKHNRLNNYERITAFSEGRSLEGISSTKNWKDILSYILVPLSYVITMLISSFIFSLF